MSQQGICDRTLWANQIAYLICVFRTVESPPSIADAPETTTAESKQKNANNRTPSEASVSESKKVSVNTTANAPIADTVPGSKQVTVKASDEEYINRPNIDGAKFLINGEIREWSGEIQTVESPIFVEGTNEKVIYFRNSLLVGYQQARLIRPYRSRTVPSSAFSLDRCRIDPAQAAVFDTVRPIQQANHAPRKSSYETEREAPQRRLQSDST